MSTSEKKSVTTDEVTKFLAFLVALTIAKSVDDENYVIDVSTGKRTLLGEGPEARELVLYQERIPTSNVYTLNPLADGLSDTAPPQRFLNRLLRFSLNTRIKLVILSAIKMVLTQAGKTVVEKAGSLPDVGAAGAFLDIVSGSTEDNKKIVDQIDVKAFEEIEAYLSLSETVNDLTSITYTRRTITSKFHCPIIETPGFVDTITGMRKRTAHVLAALLKNVLKVRTAADLSEFSTRADVNSHCSAFLATWLGTMFKVYARFSDALDVLAGAAQDEIIAVDLGTFKTHLGYLDLYAGNARWMTQGAMTSSTAAATAPGAASANGVPTLGIPALGSTTPGAAPAPHKTTVPTISASTGGSGVPGMASYASAPRVPILDSFAGLNGQQNMGMVTMGPMQNQVQRYPGTNVPMGGSNGQPQFQQPQPQPQFIQPGMMGQQPGMMMVQQPGMMMPGTNFVGGMAMGTSVPGMPVFA